MTTSVPVKTGARPPFPVPGLVDGLLTTARDPDGNVCLYVVFSAGPLCGEHHVEFVLSPDDARFLQRSLLDGPRNDAVLVPCRVGLRLRHEYL